MHRLIGALIPGAQRLHDMQPGQILCSSCAFIGEPGDFPLGKGRDKGQHPEMRYCPKCGASIEWSGYIEKLPDGKLRRVA